MAGGRWRKYLWLMKSVVAVSAMVVVAAVFVAVLLALTDRRRGVRPSLAVHAPWSRRMWRDVAFVVGGVPVQFAALAVLTVPWVAGTGPMSFVQVMAALLVPAAVVFVAVPVLTEAQRHRFAAMLGLAIPPPSVIERPWTWRGFLVSLRSEATWRQLGYHLVAAPALAMGALAALGAWVAGAALALFPVYRYALPPGSPVRDIGLKAWIIAMVVGSVAFLLVAPSVTTAVRLLDSRAAAALLGPNRARELERRVETLRETRAGVVDAADTERRRIERDLHDGAQQRLVSLAMNLGIAKATLTGLPDEAREVIADAHEEAKAALAELRHLVRGLHPAVLEDRGLDAALSGIAARMPVPVRLTVDVPQRPSPTVEAVAYFVVSEGLANISKHARASQAEVSVERTGDVLQVIVTDDGVGGADPALGTGLAGLAKRAKSVDGTFDISSPPGGPTLIAVELPCGS
jgi:signal transduction histidine kinase